ncbi:GTP 3',8-cyclase MoaA [Thermodesulfobacteriota bacterium]
MQSLKLIDQYDRNLNYLRISITDRCNLACLYCVPADLIPKLAHRDILTYEEILRLVRIGIRLGISKVRVTGGEPLIRKGVYDFLAELSATPGLSDVSLTTNGVFLRDNIDKIRSAGIRRINVSLDTLKREKFKMITGLDKFPQVWEGIIQAHKAGFHPIKLNVVALGGINEDEFVDFGKLTLSHPFHGRYTEFMPIGKPRQNLER